MLTSRRLKLQSSIADSPSGFLSAHDSLMPRGPGLYCRLQEFRTTCSFSGFAHAIPSIHSAIPVSTTCPVPKHPSWLKSCHLSHEEDFHIPEGVSMHPLFTTLGFYPMEESTLVPMRFLYVWAPPPMCLSAGAQTPAKQDLSLPSDSTTPLLPCAVCP